MKKNHKMRNFLIALSVVIVGSLLFLFGRDIQNLFVTNNELQETEKLLEQEQQRNQQLEVELQDYQKSLEEDQKDQTAELQKNDEERIKLLEDFGKKWINYATVYERNQSVKSYLTDKAIEDNAIDTDPHADFKGAGEITSISRQTNDPNKYILVGNEKTKEQDNILMIEVEFAETEDKIDVIRVYYVRQIV